MALHLERNDVMDIFLAAKDIETNVTPVHVQNTEASFSDES